MAQAKLNGQLIDDGGAPCDVRFEWGTTRDYGNVTPWQGGFTSGMTFFATIYGLAEGVPYHFRAVAQNSYGTTYGNDVVFSTPVGSTIPVLLDDAALVSILGGI
jgi:hypothetical protein